MAVEDASFDSLAQAVGEGDKHAAFAAAHDLKGVLGNLSLTPVYSMVSQMTELLRSEDNDNDENNEDDTDYPARLAAIMEQRDKIRALC